MLIEIAGRCVRIEHPGIYIPATSVPLPSAPKPSPSRCECAIWGLTSKSLGGIIKTAPARGCSGREKDLEVDASQTCLKRHNERDLAPSPSTLLQPKEFPLPSTLAHFILFSAEALLSAPALYRLSSLPTESRISGF